MGGRNKITYVDLRHPTRKVIFEMVNDSLFLYLSKFVQNNYPQIGESKSKVSELVYFNQVNCDDEEFCSAIVNGLDKFKMLDPATGSGAFPMGMLHRMVDILKLVDVGNELWITLKLKNVDVAQRAEFKKALKLHLNDYSRKLGIIRDSIYGIDIQPLAVQITKLRFFISLLIDQRTEKGITPMPNIETKIICADSLKSIKTDMFSNDAIAKLIIARARYYQPDISHNEREAIANEIVAVLDTAFPSFAYQITGKRTEGQNKALIKKWFTHSTIAAPFFNMDFFFPELNECKGFDCVIGNPPYGGTKISDEVRESLGIESKDPYGAFIARFLNNADKPTPLKNGGVLAYIASDTFMTIKSHLPLRRMLMQNYIHKMLRVHPDTFRATVNTVIMVAERNVYTKGEKGLVAETFNTNHTCLMADLTNISIHDNYDHFVEVLNATKIPSGTEALRCVSNEEYAIYYYPQALIKTNSNLPFFVASPKLFALMNDSGKDLKKEVKEIGGKQVQVRKILFNGKEIELVKLGDIAEVKVGLQTGDNDIYLFQKPEARGTYRSIEGFKEYLLTEADLDKLRNNESLRLAIIYKGINKDDPECERYFGGRFIIPYDKGGESDSSDGWLPNYFVPTSYFICWDELHAQALINQTLVRKESTLPYPRNKDFYFKLGITYSRTGNYAPTFRSGTASVFDDKSCTLFFIDNIDVFNNLALCTSKILKFFFKNFQGHTVDAQVDDLKAISYSLNVAKNKIIGFNASKLYKNQQSNPRYDYASQEQIEIDKLVYEAYGLNAEDVQEVENWYARRYPKLSAAQKQNLRNLGKSDDYLELYGLK